MNPADYQVKITLAFRNDTERDYFLGQLSDGWGENYCQLQARDTNLGWTEQSEFLVDPTIDEDFFEEEEEDEEIVCSKCEGDGEVCSICEEGGELCDCENWIGKPCPVCCLSPENPDVA